VLVGSNYVLKKLKLIALRAAESQDYRYLDKVYYSQNIILCKAHATPNYESTTI